MAHQQLQGNEIAALVRPVWSETKVCESLGVTVDGLAARRESGEVLGLVTSDGVTVYPVWQFRRRDERAEVNPALLPVLRTLRGFNPWMVAVLLHTPCPELGNATPLQWLAQGGSVEDVWELARVVAREWNAGSGPPGLAQRA